jgi:hypothetical protein
MAMELLTRIVLVSGDGSEAAKRGVNAANPPAAVRRVKNSRLCIIP